MNVSAKATHRQTRRYNRRLVLRTSYDGGPLRGAEVARLTGLTRTTVSDVVGNLIADGMAEEVGRGPSSGGKAQILTAVRDDGGNLPLRFGREERILAMMPQPVDRTPADISATVPLGDLHPVGHGL